MAELEAQIRETGNKDKLKEFYSSSKEIEGSLTNKDIGKYEDILNTLGVDINSAGYLKGANLIETPVKEASGGEAGDWVKVGNQIHKFSSSDVALGIDPAGVKGPLKNVLSGMSSIGGGRGMINININGGDEQRVYAVVQRALADAGYNS